METGIPMEDLEEGIRGGLLPAERSQTIGDFMIKRDDLLKFVKLSKGTTKFTKLNLNKKILIIDDEVNFANIMKYELERDKRMTVKTATYGKDGMSLARIFKPDVYLIDFMLPDITGDKILAELDQLRKATKAKVVVYSAHSEDAMFKVEGFQERLKTLGADAFISKTGGMKPLIAKLYELVVMEPPQKSVKL